LETTWDCSSLDDPLDDAMPSLTSIVSLLGHRSAAIEIDFPEPKE